MYSVLGLCSYLENFCKRQGCDAKKTAENESQPNIPASALSHSEEPVISVQTEESNEDQKEDDGKYWNTPQHNEESS